MHLMITEVCLERVLVEWSVYMGNGCFWCAAMVLTITDVCLERVLQESGVYMGNGWFCASRELRLTRQDKAASTCGLGAKKYLDCNDKCFVLTAGIRIPRRASFVSFVHVSIRNGHRPGVGRFVPEKGIVGGYR